MIKAMKHRGPDDQGVFLDGNISLGHTRLSIIDLSLAGHQPMFSDDQRYVIVFNGEIYNYLELKDELSASFSFRTKTDTEVVMQAYRHWGKDCLNHFNGMFALAIYDRQERLLFVARDRFGVKPLYYYQDADTFIFASEITPLLTILGSGVEPDQQSIYDYLIFNRTNHKQNTFFRGIKKLQHSHCLTIKNGAVNDFKWYNLPDKICQPFANAEELRQLLKSSINLRLRSDVPLGACLSGGLDSSSIISMVMNDFHRPDLNTFSAVYGRGQAGDESVFIKEYDALIKNRHFVKPTADTLLKDIKIFVRAMQEPVPGTSAYAEFKIYELAKEKVTVILNGQGADEELAGYFYFLGFFYKELFYKMRWLKLANEVYHDLRKHNSFDGLAAFGYFLLSPGIRNSISLISKDYVDKGFIAKYSGDPAFLNILYGSSSLHQALVNHFEYKFEHHLIWGDRSSMWFSTEVRFPFLDYRFVEKVLALGNEEIIHKGQTKYIFRKAMQGIVPEKILERQDKVGYETPEAEWMREPGLSNFIYELIHSESFKKRGYFNPQKAKIIFSNHLNRKLNAAEDIWKMVHLELWFREFIDPGIKITGR